ncbi:MAG: hypothetical protein ABSA58_03580 [Acetobacteraceae bacterium]
MRNADIAGHPSPRVLDDENPDDVPAVRFTPGQFFREAGVVIAVCLGLGLFVQILLG